MPSRIPGFRVPLVDKLGSLVTIEWFTFFSDLFRLTGSGTNNTSIPDTLVGPPESGVNSDPEMGKVIQGIQVAPPQPIDNSAELAKVLDGLMMEPPVIPVIPAMTNTATLDFGNTAANAVTDLTITVPGAVDGDVVALGVPNGSVPAGGTFFGWVSAADTVTVRFANNTAGALDPASGTFRVTVSRY